MGRGRIGRGGLWECRYCRVLLCWRGFELKGVGHMLCPIFAHGRVSIEQERRERTHRIAANPKLLLKVCITHKFAYSFTNFTALASSPAKSI